MSSAQVEYLQGLVQRDTEKIKNLESQIERLTSERDSAASQMRDRCAELATSYTIPNRFEVSEQWKELTPSQVFNTAANDVGTWISNEIANLPLAPESRLTEDQMADLQPRM
jgi:predicted nuclease with TOPRIM domain